MINRISHLFDDNSNNDDLEQIGKKFVRQVNRRLDKISHDLTDDDSAYVLSLLIDSLMERHAELIEDSE